MIDRIVLNPANLSVKPPIQYVCHYIHVFSLVAFDAFMEDGPGS